MPPAGVKSARPAHRCSECGYASAKWVGRCPECQAWGSVQEIGAPAGGLRAVSAGPVTVANPTSNAPRTETYDFHQEAGTTEG